MTTAGHVERYRRARRDPALAVLEGFHALKHALRFGAAVEEAVSPDPAAVVALAADHAPDVAARLAELVAPVPRGLFERLAPVVPATGVLALARRPAARPAELLAAAGGTPLVLLQGTSHLGNLGAAVRVAAAAGAAGVVTLGRHDPWHPEALRAAAGLHFALPVVRLETLPASHRPLIAVDPQGEPLTAGAVPPGALLAFGGERHGLAPELLAGASRRLAIPMRPGVSSLNLATAVAVVLYATWALAERRDR